MISKANQWAPDRGEIIWIDCNPSIGREMPDIHPMLVSSTRTFNEKTGIVIGFPMTHAAFNADNPFAVTVLGPNNEVAYILGFQPKSFDWRERNAKPHPWGDSHEQVLRSVLQILDTICGVCPSKLRQNP
jgi:mRNA interferase MazF